MALVAPAMLLLMLVAVDFGRLFFTYIAVTNAAREATSYAAVHAADTPWDATAYRASVSSAGTQETNVQSQGSEGTLTLSDPTCFDPQTSATIDCHAASDYAVGIGNQVRVTASQQFTFVTPLIGDILGGSLTLAASGTAPVLNPADTTILPAPTPSPGATPPPTATPDPTPTPTATTTLPPGATPTPTQIPTPTPVPTCTVPDFFNTYWNDPSALNTWHDIAGFSGTLTDRSDGKKIKTQSLPGGSSQLCTASMTVDDR